MTRIDRIRSLVGEQGQHYQPFALPLGQRQSRLSTQQIEEESHEKNYRFDPHVLGPLDGKL